MQRLVKPQDICIKFACSKLIRRTVKEELSFLVSDSSQKLKAASEMPTELKQRQNPP